MKARVPPMTMVSIDWRFGCRIRGRLNPEGAANSTKDAADDATDDTTKGSCCLGAHSGAMRGAVGDALGLRRKRTSE
jgi:hypothetical protein